MPLRLGRTRSQPGPGSSGSSTSPRWSIARSLVATRGSPPAARTSAYAGTERTYWIASISGPLPPDAFEVLGRAGVRDRQPPVAAGHRPLLDAPAPLARDLREARVRVHRDRRGDQLHHGEVRDGVGIGEALTQVEAVPRRVLLQQRGARLARGRRRRQVAG